MSRDTAARQAVWPRRLLIKSGLVAGACAVADMARLSAYARASPPADGSARDLAALSISEAADLVRRRKVSSLDLTRACLDRIDRLNALINAFITVTAKEALSRAREADAEIGRGRWRGPLHGIPIGLKDNIDTAGTRTTAASAVFADRVPTEDAEVVRRLKAAGAVLLGKQNLHEVAFGTTAAVSYFGAVHNPWQRDRIAGGSSGGSAAAVAAGLCFGAVGTDAGGSIRVPSAYCGIVGLKPTFGLVSMRGAGDAGWWSMNHVGPLCRSVGDAALLFSAMAGYDARDSSSVAAPASDYAAALRANVSSLRLGAPRSVFYDGLDPEIAAAVDLALDVLRRLTAGQRDVGLPPIADTMAPNIVLAENYAFHAPHFAKTPQLYPAAISRNLNQGSKVTAAAYIQSRRELDEVRRAIVAVFSHVDVLITPTTPVPAPTIEETLRLGIELELIRNTAPFNVYGLPTVSIPCGFTRSGMPIGLQITGSRFGESTVLALAHAYEQATDWHTRRPRVAQRAL